MMVLTDSVTVSDEIKVYRQHTSDVWTPQAIAGIYGLRSYSPRYSTFAARQANARTATDIAYLSLDFVLRQMESEAKEQLKMALALERQSKSARRIVLNRRVVKIYKIKFGVILEYSPSPIHLLEILAQNVSRIRGIVRESTAAIDELRGKAGFTPLADYELDTTNLV